MARKKEMYSPENHDPGAGIVLMKLDELHSFEGYPFNKVEKNQELFELRCSIEKEGVSQFDVGRYPVTSALKRFRTSAHLYTILILKQTYLRPFNTNKDRIKAI